MLFLKDFRSKAKGLADLLPYAALVEENIILNKDGSLMAVYDIRGADTDSASAEELKYLSARVNQAIKNIGSGFMIQVESIRLQAKTYPKKEESFFPDNLTVYLDNIRRKNFSSGNYYKTLTFLTISYKASTLLNANLKKITSNKEVKNFEANIEYFKKALINIEDDLSLSVTMHRLGSLTLEDNSIRSLLLSYLELSIFNEKYLPIINDTPMYLDSMLATQDLSAGFKLKSDDYELKLGDFFLGVIAIENFPSASYPQMLAALSSLPFEAKFSTRYIALDQYVAVKEVDKYRKTWASNIYSFLDKVLNKVNPRPDLDALQMSKDAETVYTDLKGNYVGAGYYTANIVLKNQDKEALLENVRIIRKTLADLGFGTRLESMNGLQAWLSTHPGNSFANIRRPLITTLNLADLLPISSTWTGSEYNPCPFYPPKSPALCQLATDNSTVFWFNFHYTDIAHTSVIGPTGAGKSTFLCLSVSQFLRYKDAKVFFFDKGKSIYALCKGAKGNHYNIGGKDIEGISTSFCPLKNIHEPQEKVWAEDWICSLCELQNITLLPGHKSAIHEAISQLANQPETMRTLTNFVQTVQNHEIKETLRHYTLNGSMGHLLDAEADNIEESNFTVFEIEELMNMGEENTIPVLLYLFHLIERSLKGQPTLVVMDEAWILLSKPWVAAKIKEMLKVMRKANCGVVLATQSISDVSASGIIDVINESCFTKIYLANEKANEPISQPTYYSLGCTERDIEIIAGAKPKREYYIKTPEGSRLVSLALSKKELAFYGVSSKEDLAKVDEFIQKYNANWQERWLEFKGE